MPPKLAKVDLKPFPARDENFTISGGFVFGKGDNPPLYGQKVVPVGKPNCLFGNTFVPTGTMVSLKRDQVKDLVQQYGGKVTSSISGKTDCVIVGCMEVGPKKIQTCKDKGIPMIDEDGLFYIIARSNPEKNKDFLAKYEKKRDEAENEAKEEEEKEEEKEEEQNTATSDNKQTEAKKSLINLAEKYRPKDISQVVGGMGAKNQIKEYFTKFPNVKNKILLITGGPGTGKTTLAHLMASSCGYHVEEFNASDVRSKSEIEHFVDVVNNKVIESNNKKKQLGKVCIIFDEIEGLGAGDRGGLSAIVNLAKTTKIPIVCIMNSKSDRKYDPLYKVSETITIPKLDSAMIVQRIRSIAQEEGIQIKPAALQNIAQRANGDLRFAINYLEFWVGSNNNMEKVQYIDNVVDATRLILSSRTPFDDKLNCSFVDDAVSLYVQYNLAAPKNDTMEDYLNYTDALESTCFGDIIETELRQTQNYNLAPASNYLSSVCPTCLSKQDVDPLYLRAEMPKLMMSYSRMNKFDRYANEITNNLHCSKIDAPITALNISSRITKLTEKEKYSAAVDYLVYNNLDIEGYEHCIEFSQCGSKKKEIKVPKELKSAYLESHSKDDPLIVQTAGKKMKLEDDKKKKAKEEDPEKAAKKEKKKKEKDDKKKEKEEKKKEKKEKKDEKKKEKEEKKKEKDEKKKEKKEEKKHKKEEKKKKEKE